jgi:hypothetical protein
MCKTIRSANLELGATIPGAGERRLKCLQIRVITTRHSMRGNRSVNQLRFVFPPGREAAIGGARLADLD